MRSREPEQLGCAPQVPVAGKPPKRARLALKPKPAKAGAASRPRAAPPRGAQCGGSPSDDECAPDTLCKHLPRLRHLFVRCCM